MVRPQRLLHYRICRSQSNDICHIFCMTNVMFLWILSDCFKMGKSSSTRRSNGQLGRFSLSLRHPIGSIQALIQVIATISNQAADVRQWVTVICNAPWQTRPAFPPCEPDELVLTKMTVTFQRVLLPQRFANRPGNTTKPHFLPFF